MEQKKTLWITLAAGIFLLVVIGAAVILYKDSGKKQSTKELSESGDIWITPSQDIGMDETYSYSQGFATSETENTAASEEEIPAVDEDSAADETLTEGEAEQGKTVDTVTADNLTVISSGTTNIYPSGTTTIDLTSKNVKPQNQTAQNAMTETEKAKAAATPSQTYTEQPEKTEQISVKETQTASQTKKTEEKAQPASSSNTKTASSQTKSSSSSTQSKTASTASKASSSSNTKKQAAAAKTPDRFWVQAASYTSKKNADEARAILDANKIQCEVFTFTDDKGTLYYRVRVGPYTTKSEAEYWKQRIDSIELFSRNNTYITNTSASK